MGEPQRDAFGLCGAVIAGKYRVLEVVGEGGFGVVYRGHHADFDEPVAIKCLKLPAHLSEAEQDALIEKLRDEGKLLLRLSRRTTGIVQALDVGAHVSATGVRIPYLVLEWLDGKTLAQELRERRGAGIATTLAEALELLRPVAAALAVAHAESVAHRDIKPDNLMLVRRGSAKVLDFGIAKVLEEATSAADAKTSAAVPVFTPGYGAPEQFEKRRGATGPWTDVFSLGLVFVEIVSGRQAITGDELIDLYKKTTDPVQRPTLRSVGVEAPPAVEKALRKALDVDPAARYGNAGAFFEALEAAVAEGGEAVHPTSGGERDPQQLASAPTEEFVSGRAPAAPQVATVSAEPATGALLASTTQPQVLSTEAPAAARSRVGLALGAGLALLSAVGLVAMLRSPSPGAPAPSEPSTQIESASSARAPLVEPELGLKTVAQYRDPPAELAGNPLTTTAWRAAAKSFEVACAQPGAAPRWCAGRDFCDAQIDFMRDQLDDAERRYQAAAVTDPSWAMPHAGLAAVWTQRKNLEKALDEAAIAQQLEPDWWGAIAAGARAYSALDRFDGAIGEYRRALALAPDSATLLSELALTYHAAHFDAEATKTATRALALSPDLVHIRVMLAERALEAGDGTEALLQADKALAIAPRHVTSLLARADALMLLSRTGDAREAYVRMLEVARASGSAKLEPRLQLVADALEQKQLPPARGLRRTSPPPQSSGSPQIQTEPKPERSKPAPTCRCAASDPLCSCL